MAQLPNCVALTARSTPFRLPIGVRTAAVIKHSRITLTTLSWLDYNQRRNMALGLMTSRGFLDPFRRQDDVGSVHQAHVFTRHPCLDNSLASTILTRPSWGRARTVPA